MIKKLDKWCDIDGSLPLQMLSTIISFRILGRK